jgi:hypothetical protein
MSIRAISALVLVAAACGPPASVNGTLGGMVMHVADAISTNATVIRVLKDGTVTRTNEGLLFITNMPTYCNAVATSKQIKNMQRVELDFVDLVSGDATNGFVTAAPTSPGTYDAYAGQAAPAKVFVGAYEQSDASCLFPDVPPLTNGGVVTLTGVNNGSYSGNFDVMFDNGDHITGAFGTNNCTPLSVAINSATTPVCL